MTYYKLKEEYFSWTEGETRHALNHRILEAAYNGDLDAVRAAIQEDPTSVNAQHELTLSTPLHYACSLGRYAMVEFLLSCKEIDLDITDMDGLQPHQKALMAGHPGVITIMTFARYPFLYDLGYRGEGVEPAPYPTPEEGGETEEEEREYHRRAVAILSRFAVEGGGRATDDLDTPPPPTPTGP